MQVIRRDTGVDCVWVQDAHMLILRPGLRRKIELELTQRTMPHVPVHILRDWLGHPQMGQQWMFHRIPGFASVCAAALAIVTMVLM